MNGRLAFLADRRERFAAVFTLERHDLETQVVAAPDAGGYRTVCGVTVDGRTVRYVFFDRGRRPAKRAPTTLRFHDMVMVLYWQSANRVRVELEGTAPIEGTWR